MEHLLKRPLSLSDAKVFTFLVRCKGFHVSRLSPFSPSDVSSYIIYVGRYQLNGINSHDSTHFVSRVVIPSGYVEPYSGKDVALVELTTPVIWSDYVRPVCLPSSGTLFPGGMMCYVTGWGNIRDDGKAPCHVYFSNALLTLQGQFALINMSANGLVLANGLFFNCSLFV